MIPQAEVLGVACRIVGGRFLPGLPQQVVELRIALDRGLQATNARCAPLREETPVDPAGLQQLLIVHETHHQTVALHVPALGRANSPEGVINTPGLCIAAR